MPVSAFLAFSISAVARKCIVHVCVFGPLGISIPDSFVIIIYGLIFLCMTTNIIIGIKPTSSSKLGAIQCTACRCTHNNIICMDLTAFVTVYCAV